MAHLNSNMPETCPKLLERIAGKSQSEILADPFIGESFSNAEF